MKRMPPTSLRNAITKPSTNSFWIIYWDDLPITPMTPREVVKEMIAFRRPPYVPWSIRFTLEAREKLEEHFGTKDIDPFVKNHFLELGNGIGFFDDTGHNRFRDVFRVTWDRSIDKDIGNVTGQVLSEPTLKGYHFPNPIDSRFFADIPERIKHHGELYRVFCIGFSLFERAWTLRGLESLYMDFIENPDFVHELLEAITDYNIAQVKKALEYDIDAVYFGDDWGTTTRITHGLRLVEGVYFSTSEADVCNGQRGRENGLHPFLRRCR
jgi:uroporphyrinogen decarboxylase